MKWLQQQKQMWTLFYIIVAKSTHKDFFEMQKPYVQTRMSKLHKCEFDISKKKHNDKAELNFFCEFPWEKTLNSYPNALSKFKTVMVQLDAKWWSY